jgi:hypothetical protein
MPVYVIFIRERTTDKSELYAYATLAPGVQVPPRAPGQLAANCCARAFTPSRSIFPVPSVGSAST